MNRRGFLGSLVAIPAALKALALAPVLAPTFEPSWGAPSDDFMDAFRYHDWKSLHAPIIYSGDQIKTAAGGGELLQLVQNKIWESERSFRAAMTVR